MIYVLVDEDGPRQVSGAFTAQMTQTYDVWGFPVPKVETVVFPPGWLQSASADELAAAGVRVLDDPPSAPAGKVIVSQALALNADGEPYWSTRYGKAPTPANPPPAPTALQATVALPSGLSAPITINLSAEQIALLEGRGA